MFSNIHSNIDVAPQLRPALTNLQIPLAKLAVLEPQFFEDKSHPARGVIDKLTHLAASANYPNPTLEKKVQGIVDNIVDNYQTDSTVFDTALEDTDKLIEQQKNALARNVERVVKTHEGQQQLSNAQTAVDKILQTRIRPPTAPQPLVDLIDNGWRDLLVLTHVKDGPHSRAYKDYVKTLDLLSLWLIEQQKGGEDVQMEKALEADTFVDMVKQQISTALPTNVSHEPILDELREILSGRQKAKVAKVKPYPIDTRIKPAQKKKKIESLPRLRRWMRRVHDLKKGTWLNYRDKKGQKQRMQLAWISDDKERFIFVDERGRKIADMTSVSLARHLAKGYQPPSPAEDLSLVDQSMYGTLEKVQKTLSFRHSHDKLTKLINKDAFLKQIDSALKNTQQKRISHALLYMDIDQFGLVNDLYDEVSGDEVLSEFATLLSGYNSEKSSIARLDGNAFACLLLERSLS